MGKLFGSIALATFAFLSGPVAAQTTGNGPYYANPSWDQQLPAAQRFIVLSNWNNEAVLDRETGLVWERSPSDDRADWFTTLAVCNTIKVGNRLGWRLPSLQELNSLVDPTQKSPSLPPGHPFQNVQGFLGQEYWTATQTESNDQLAYAVEFSVGADDFGSLKGNALNRWCVRGGAAASNPPY